jgi:hypothetical protein
MVPPDSRKFAEFADQNHSGQSWSKPVKPEKRNTGIAQFQPYDSRKGTQRAQRQELMLFFLCDPCVLSWPIHLWLRLAAPGFSCFFGNSSQVPLPESFTPKTGFFQSCPVVANRV